MFIQHESRRFYEKPQWKNTSEHKAWAKRVVIQSITLISLTPMKYFGNLERDGKRVIWLTPHGWIFLLGKFISLPKKNFLVNTGGKSESFGANWPFPSNRLDYWSHTFSPRVRVTLLKHQLGGHRSFSSSLFWVFPSNLGHCGGTKPQDRLGIVRKSGQIGWICAEKCASILSNLTCV